MEESQKDWWASEGTLVDEETMARICCMEETIHGVENPSEALIQWQHRTINFLWDVFSVSDDSAIDKMLRTKSFHDFIPLISRIIENRSESTSSNSVINLIEQEQMYIACLGIISAASARGFCELVNLPILISQLQIVDALLTLSDDARTMIAGILFNVALMSKDGVEKIATLIKGNDLSSLLAGANKAVVDQLASQLLGGNSIEGK
ncbi:hypothetical protein ACOME3_002886 [Neoechinorhynchus agilis]